MKKVFILQRIIPNYREHLFREISKINEVNLTIYYNGLTKDMKRASFIQNNIFKGFKSKKIPLNRSEKNRKIFCFIKDIINSKPDVVIIGEHSKKELLLFTFLHRVIKFKLLFFFGGIPVNNEPKLTFKQVLYWFYKKQLYQTSDGFLVYSEHAKEYYRSKGISIPINVAYNAPDTKAWIKVKKGLSDKNLRKFRETLAPKNYKIILLLGRLTKSRRALDLIKAVKEIKKMGQNVKLVIIGDGNEKPYLEGYNLKHNLGITFTGGIYDTEELAKYFSICDIYNTPGVASLSVKIAMIFGKPVISCDYGLEVHDIENGFNGYVYPISDVKELKLRIIKLLDDDLLCKKLGSNGYLLMKNKINTENQVSAFKGMIFS